MLLSAGAASGQPSPPVYDFQFASAGSESGQINTPLAMATDSAGTVWVVDRMNNRIDEFKSDGGFIEAIGFGVIDGEAKYEICRSSCRAGIDGSGPGQFNNPRGIAIDQIDGDIYVSDAGNDRIEEFSSTASYLGSFGSSGGGIGELNSPNGIAIDSVGHIWVADTQNNRIEEFDPKGEALTAFGSQGSGDGQLKSPQDVAISDRLLSVADWGNNRIEEFSTAGGYRGQFGSSGSGDGYFSNPSRIAADPLNGDIYVSDNGNSRVQVFRPDGTFLTKFGSAGREEGQFASLKAVAISATGAIYTADAGDQRVQVWVLGAAPKPGQSAPPAYASTLAFPRSDGGGFEKPDAAAVDPNGNILIADSRDDRIVEFNSEGEYVRQFGSPGDADGEFDGIGGVATDASGDIYATDHGNDRVEEFAPSGVYVRMFGSSNSDIGRLSKPGGIAVEPSRGTVWVRSGSGVLLQEFSATGTYLAGFGSAGRLTKDSGEVGGLAFSDGKLYLPEAASAAARGSGETHSLATVGRVQEFSGSGKSLGHFNTPGSEPHGIAADPRTGDLYVTELGSNRVSEFTPTGGLIATFGSGGRGAGQLSEPKGVAVGGFGEIFIADTANNRVQEWVMAAAPTVRWEANNVLATPTDTGTILTNSGGENELSPPCIFPLGVFFSRICEAPAFPEGYFVGEESPVVVASRRLTNLTAGETLDAAADVELSNTSDAGSQTDPIAASLQLALSTSPTSANPAEAQVLADMTNAPSGEITDYDLEHHAVLLSRGAYTVPASFTGPVYVDAVVTASLPAGSTFGEHACVDSPGTQITGSDQNLCPIESDARFSTLSVQRFQPAGANSVPLAVEEAEDPSTPGQGEATTFPITGGSDLDYPYTAIWESGEITKLSAAHCPPGGAESPGVRGEEACAFVEAHSDLSVVLKNPGCSVLLGGRFFLTQDRDIVAQARNALDEVQEKVARGEQPEYSLRTGKAALEEKFPSYAAYEASGVRFNGEAGTNVTGVDTGIGEATGVDGALSMTATVPVSRETLQGGDRSPWYVALEVAPEQVGCADSLTIDGDKSHAEALIFRPPGPGEDVWGETAGAPVATEPVGSELTSAPAPLLTGAVTVKAGDVIDVGADVPIEDGLSEAAKELVTLTPCLTLAVGQATYPVGSCAVQDLSILQKTTDLFHSGSFTVPATVAAGTPAKLSYTVQATAPGRPSPARVGGVGDLDVEVYEPQP